MPGSGGDWADGGRERAVKGSTKKKTLTAEAEAIAEQPAVAVGDRVKLALTGFEQGVIEEVVPRAFERRMARKIAGRTQEEQVLLANLDLMCVVFAVKDPLPHFRMLDRFLVVAEMYHTPAIILLNKADLGIEPEVAELATVYRKVGYPVFFTSTADGEGLPDVRQHLTDTIALFTGPSGVGKSALVAAFTGAENVAVSGDTSIFTGKGRHTTTSTRLIPLQGEGFWPTRPACANWPLPASTKGCWRAIFQRCGLLWANASSPIANTSTSRIVGSSGRLPKVRSAHSATIATGA